MKQHYITCHRLSLWIRLTKKWNRLYKSVKATANSEKLIKLNNLSLLLGVKKKIALTALVGGSVLGLNAQASFEEVTERSEQALPIPIGVTYSSAPTFIDFDDDGDLDLVIGRNRGTLKYFKNNSNVFTEQKGANNPFDGIDVGRGTSPEFIDFDNDGDLDLVVGERYGTIKYFKNTSNVFTEQTGANNPFGGIDVERDTSPEFIDFDDDGDLDLVVGERLGTLKYFKNTSNVFTEQTGANNPFGGIDIGRIATPTFTDYDEDGDLDLIVGEQYGTIKYFKNTSNVFTEQTGINNPFDGIDVGDYPTPTFVDLDNDSDLDLVVGETDGKLKYFKNTSNVFTEQTGANNPFTGVDVGDYSVPAFADVDDDSDLDLVIGEFDGKLKYFKNASNVFTEQTGTNNPFDGIDVGSISTPTFADVDGDDDLDLVVGEQYGTLKYFKNTSNVFTEQTGTNNPFDGIDVGYRSTPAFVDVDDDGDLDLVVGEQYGTLNFFKNTTGVFTEQTGTDNPFDGIYNPPSFGDIDRDGDLDLILGQYYGTLKYFKNTTGVFTEQTGTDNPFDGITVVSGIAKSLSPTFADIDEDGDLDMFVGERYGTIIEYRNIDKTPVGLLSSAETEQLSIYPNPATSIINTEEGALEIVDLTGNLVVSTESNGKVDVSNLETGVYIVTQNGKRTKLIIK